MTPDTIRKIQDGKVFDYTEKQEMAASTQADPIVQLLEEQYKEEQSAGTVAGKRKGMGKTLVAPPPQPETVALVPLADRPKVDLGQLVQWIVDHPGATHAEIGTAYGRPAGWFATVMVTQEFLQAMEPRRQEISNPAVTNTIQERFQALLLRSVDVLQTKLSVAAPGDALVLEAAKLGVRALGLGADGRGPAAPGDRHSLESLADRLTSLVTSKTKGSGIGSVPGVVDVTPKGE